MNLICPNNLDFAPDSEECLNCGEDGIELKERCRLNWERTHIDMDRDWSAPWEEEVERDKERR